MAKDLWPADLHLIGKEIVRFHAVFWPAFLMAGGTAAAQADLRPRLAAVRKRQDEQDRAAISCAPSPSAR